MNRRKYIERKAGCLQLQPASQIQAGRIHILLRLLQLTGAAAHRACWSLQDAGAHV